MRNVQFEGWDCVRKEHWDAETPVSVPMEQPGGLMFAYGGTVEAGRNPSHTESVP